MSTAQQLKAAATRTADDPKENILQGLLNRPFDPDAWHAMDERDNQLLRDEILHGASSKVFVYEFPMEGKTISGVSVIGARELASQYKGIKSRIVATVEKRGAMFIFRTFQPLTIDVRTLHELESDDDFYECVLEIDDIKTGNSLQVRKKEMRMERKRDGSGMFERKHYDVIAESKAYRNGVLGILPQSVIQDFKKRCLAAGNSTTEETIDQLRAKVLTFGAKNSVPMNRAALAALTYAEILGLANSARESLDAFKSSAAALSLSGGAEPAAGSPPASPPPPPAQPAGKKGGKAAKNEPQAPAQAPADQAKDQPTDAPPPKKTYAQFADMILKASDADSGAVFLDQANGQLPADQVAELGKVYRGKWAPEGGDD